MEQIWSTFLKSITVLQPSLKGTVLSYYPIHFLSQIQHISSHGSLCALQFVRTQSWLCKIKWIGPKQCTVPDADWMQV